MTECSDERQKGDWIDNPTYMSWGAMRQRCLNLKNAYYERYGGRGITICSSWDSFAKFQEDMGDRPSNMTLDRIDYNGNYEPKNCKWSTRQEQSQNTSRTIKPVIDGIAFSCLSHACIHFNKNRSTVLYRIKRGWSVERALKTMPQMHKPHIGIPV